MGLTTTRISRPAWMAYAFSTPGNEVASCSRACRRWMYISTDSFRAPGLEPEMASAAATSTASTYFASSSPWWYRMALSTAGCSW